MSPEFCFGGGGGGGASADSNETPISIMEGIGMVFLPRVEDMHYRCANMGGAGRRNSSRFLFEEMNLADASTDAPGPDCYPLHERRINASGRSRCRCLTGQAALKSAVAAIWKRISAY
jgi:hypothetical protein